MRKKILASFVVVAAALTGCVGVPDEARPLPTTTTSTTTTTVAPPTTVTTTTLDPDDLDNWPPDVVQFVVETQDLDIELGTEYLVELGFQMCLWVDSEAEMKLIEDTYGEHDATILLEAAGRWLCG